MYQKAKQRKKIHYLGQIRQGAILDHFIIFFKEKWHAEGLIWGWAQSAEAGKIHHPTSPIPLALWLRNQAL